MNIRSGDDFRFLEAWREEKILLTILYTEPGMLNGDGVVPVRTLEGSRKGGGDEEEGEEVEYVHHLCMLIGEFWLKCNGCFA